MLSSAWARPNVIDDDRALETDIMRFMAILGFCLMAIFALIQSIPVSQQLPGVGLQTQSALKQQLEEQLDQLHEQVLTLLSKVASLQSEVGQLQQSNTQWQAQHQAVTEQLNRSQAHLLEQSATAQQLLQALQNEQQALASAQSEARRLQRQAYREQLRIESAERALEQLQSALVQPSSQDVIPEPSVLEPEMAEPEMAEPETAKSQLPKASLPSLTMRYASTAAIERLIAAQRTVLFGISGQRAWRSTPQGDFVAAPKPVHPYELTEDPGPVLMQRFRRGSGLLSASTVQWWVTLDESIVSQIAAHLDAHQSGQLVIQANGQVLHQPAVAAALSE